ncbi:MAG: hypothetical protein NTY47_01355 [Candidatus Omnitrophica bacterium]|nr:hypothetical protein [Candidatus Omnitrophota bacterium]
MKKIFLISISILFYVCALGDFSYAKDIEAKVAPSGMSKSESELRASMRALWGSRATLLRAYIVSAMNDSKDTDEARDKLLKNAGDLGGSIKPYYGSWAGSILSGFLKKDVWLTGKVIEAAKKINKESPGLTVKAKEEAIGLTVKAKEEALDLTVEANKETPGMTEKSNKESADLTMKAKEEALDLTVEAKEEAIDLTKKAREEAINLAEKNNKESPDIAEKAALDLTEKAKGKALDLTEKAKRKAFDLAEKGNKESPDLTEKAKGKALGLIEMAQKIARDLIEKAKEIAKNMDEQAKKGDLEWAKNDWYENARSLAGFFAIPHNQTKKELTDMLCKHLDLTWGEINAILKKDPVKDLDYYEKDRAHMIMFSDVLTNGLVKRFPDKFRE